MANNRTTLLSNMTAQIVTGGRSTAAANVLTILQDIINLMTCWGGMSMAVQDNVTITEAAAAVVVDFDTDLGGNNITEDSTTDNDLTVTIAGDYEIEVLLHVNTAATAKTLKTSIYKNSSELISLDTIMLDTTLNSIILRAYDTLAASDVIDCRIEVETGASTVDIDIEIGSVLKMKLMD